ncbi:hypothetical protein V7124_19880 [Neobacillus niacini]|uniref:hypothetical protein n=1 Tax=Neobacillus niacini TaxID=86668 RepID=UPI002FFF8CC5
MNDLLEAKLTIARIKTRMLDLTGALIADHLTDKDYCIKSLLDIIDFIDTEDITISDIKETL